MACTGYIDDDWRPLGVLTLPAALLVAAPVPATAAPVPGTIRLYTTDADFDQGVLADVNHDAPNINQLQLDRTQTFFPYVNIANSARGTMVRIDVNTGAIIGEWRSAPDGRGRNPSRTTVDRLGNTWLSNRDEQEGGNGSVMRVGVVVGGARSNADGTPNPAGDFLKPPFGYNTCVDRTADGLIATSRGLADIRPWTNAGGVDNDGGVDTAADECIITYSRVNGALTRTVAVDAQNDLWTGGLDRDHQRISGVEIHPSRVPRSTWAVAGTGDSSTRPALCGPRRAAGRCCATTPIRHRAGCAWTRPTATTGSASTRSPRRSGTPTCPAARSSRWTPPVPCWGPSITAPRTRRASRWSRPATCGSPTR